MIFMSSQKWRMIVILIATTCSLFILLEVVLRLLGLANFPVYDKRSDLGYVPAADQSGKLMHRYGWAFNNRSMAIAQPYNPKIRPNAILLGDSIVMGTAYLSYEQRLGQLVQKSTTIQIWPIGAGSWALANELSYLNLNSDVLKNSDQIAIVSNSADFRNPSIWKNPYTHPTSRPNSISVFLMQKYLFSNYDFSNDRKTSSENSIDALEKMSLSHRGKISVFLYPTKREFKNFQDCRWADQRLLKIKTINVICISKYDTWKEEYYIDDIHPNAAGNVTLAQIIAEQLSQ